jgi:hypothetical protein
VEAGVVAAERGRDGDRRPGRRRIRQGRLLHGHRRHRPPTLVLGPLRTQLRQAGFGAAYIVLPAPLAVCASRVAAREGSAIPESDVVPDLWSQFEDLGEFAGHAVDVGDSDPGEVTAALEGILVAGSHTV